MRTSLPLYEVLRMEAEHRAHDPRFRRRGAALLAESIGAPSWAVLLAALAGAWVGLQGARR